MVKHGFPSVGVSSPSLFLVLAGALAVLLGVLSQDALALAWDDRGSVMTRAGGFRESPSDCHGKSFEPTLVAGGGVEGVAVTGCYDNKGVERVYVEVMLWENRWWGWHILDEVSSDSRTSWKYPRTGVTVTGVWHRTSSAEACVHRRDYRVTAYHEVIDSDGNKYRAETEGHWARNLC
jgi:hypothetical protein